jgi:hypothetical protein
MKSPRRLVYKFIARLIALLPASIITSWFSAKLELIRKAEGPKVIILDEGRFRDDLIGMSEYSQMELYRCPREAQDRITRIVHYLNKADTDLESDLMDLRFLCKVLEDLKQRAKMSAIMSAAVYYRRNILWERACKKVNLPFVCLHRESAVEEPDVLRRLVREKKLNFHRPFYGHQIFAGSNHFKAALVESRYVKEDMVVVTGLPRFDISYHRLQQSKNSDSKRVVLFSFMPAFSVPEVHETHGVHIEAGFVELFYSVHQVIARLALANQGYEFIIKPKWYSGLWKELIDRALERELGDYDMRPANLFVTDTQAAQDLIHNSGLVVAFNSTTIVEAILQKKPTIVPWYAEAAGQYQHNVFYKKYEDAFLVAKSEKEMETRVGEFIQGNLVDHTQPEQLLSDVCGPHDGKSSERIERAILGLQEAVI